jgi:hypothetical protein
METLCSHALIKRLTNCEIGLAICLLSFPKYKDGLLENFDVSGQKLSTRKIAEVLKFDMAW